MKKTTIVTSLVTCIAILSILQTVQADQKSIVFRRSNFSNEFKLSTPEGINARGFAEVRSNNAKHRVKIRVNGLPPGETYVILNHWFEPVQARGVPNSDDGPEDDPSCNGHFQFLGEPVVADKKGRLKVNVKVDQLAPHIWVANFAKFLKVTDNGNQSPASPDPFTIGGLVIPYEDIVASEANFVDTDPLTNCSNLNAE